MPSVTCTPLPPDALCSVPPGTQWCPRQAAPYHRLKFCSGLAVRKSLQAHLIWALCHLSPCSWADSGIHWQYFRMLKQILQRKADGALHQGMFSNLCSVPCHLHSLEPCTPEPELRWVRLTGAWRLAAGVLMHSFQCPLPDSVVSFRISRCEMLL